MIECSIFQLCNILEKYMSLGIKYVKLVFSCTLKIYFSINENREDIIVQKFLGFGCMERNNWWLSFRIEQQPFQCFISSEGFEHTKLIN